MRLTLTEWIDQQWPYVGRAIDDDGKISASVVANPSLTRPAGYVVADCVSLLRSNAWQLSDYRVSSVAGGSIWFTRKD